MKELAEMLPVGLFDFNPEPAFNIAPTQKVDPAADAAGLLPFFDTRPVEGIEVAAVSLEVNNSRNDAADCFVPVYAA